MGVTPHMFGAKATGRQPRSGAVATPKRSIPSTETVVQLADSTKRRLADRPRLVYWEVTRACDLACRHCRTETRRRPHPREMTTQEGYRFLEQVRAFDPDDPPHLVVTGGDPLKRPDLFDLVDRATELGLSVSVTPAGTSRLTADVVERFKDAGLDTLGLSLDGPTPADHDGLRGQDGCFEATVDAARTAGRVGLPLQINTLVARQTADRLPAIEDLVRDLGAARWALFFLIRTGRGRDLEPVGPAETENLLNWVADLPAGGSSVKATEAHHLRRIRHERLRSRGLDEPSIREHPVARGFGIRDGSGICFVSHLGKIYPSGFLPRSAGNVRETPLPEVYRDSEIFRALRDPDRFRGDCGRCPYREICGGSRARALAETGDPLASDPSCSYHP